MLRLSTPAGQSSAWLKPRGEKIVRPNFRIAIQVLVFTIFLLGSFSLTYPAQAASYVVTNRNNAGPGSLRQAILNANGTAVDDVITFNVSGTIDLTTAELAIASAATGGTLTINGGGAITVNRIGGTNFHIFNINLGAFVTLDGLTITNGNDAIGGGVLNNGNLTITNSVISGNTATASGGGISSIGPLTTINSVISGNTAGTTGGGISSIGPLTIINSRISGNAANSAAGGGGGLNLAGNVTNAILNSTISGNSASGQPTTAGIWTSATTLNLQNTIVAGNGSGDCDRSSGTVNASHSLI